MNLTGTKRRMAEGILRIVREWSGGDGRALVSIAQRESAFNPKAAGDLQVADKVWDRVRPQYERHGNPWTHLYDAWSASRGLYQLMVPYQLWRWDWKAHPLAIENPVVSTVIAARLFNHAQRVGAFDSVDVRMIWAFGGDGLQILKTDDRYIERLNREQDRMEKLGFPRSLATAPIAEFGLGGFGTEYQAGQEKKAIRLSTQLGFGVWPGATSPSDGDSTPMDDDQTPPAGKASIWAPLLAVGALLWGMHDDA